METDLGIPKFRTLIRIPGNRIQLTPPYGKWLATSERIHSILIKGIKTGFDYLRDSSSFFGQAD